jgi:hypothetical protein
MMMHFMTAVVDTLLPGGALPNGVNAPKASAIEVDWRSLESRHTTLVTAIAAAAGTPDAFAAADQDVRTRILAGVQAAHPEPFAALVASVLILYYEHPAVLAAFGWSTEPPQPDGHALPPFDEALLAPVKARGRLWRDPADV